MLTTRVPATPVHPSTGRLRPLGLDEVRITGGFWARRQRTNAAATLPHIAHWLEREGWIGNYDLAAAGTLPEGRRGREFADSEIYKFLEAAAWELGRRPDPALEATFRGFVARVAAAQAPDGYLSTAFGRPGQQPRWSDLVWGHELYCLGHLFQAAVARERTAPGADDGLLGIARRAADLVCEVFGEHGIQSVCGHAEVEVGLAELSRVTGEQRYLRQARLFIERRGHHVLPEPEWGRAYLQDDLPIREATVQRGHAVRANYLAAGAVDVAVETGDAELLATLRRVWDRTIARRTYLTGGQGSHFQDEAFGEDWELPPDRAYSETCASIASIMFSWRLLLATGGGGYADLIERTLFNVVAAAVSREGDRFFYTNTLHRRAPGEMPDPDAPSPRAFSSLRAPWFEVSCCPPNIARTLASLAGFLATIDDGGLQLHQFASCSISTTLPDGAPVAIDVETAYPDNGTVTVRIRESAGRPWTLGLRVPAWARGATLTHRGADGGTTTVAVTGATAQVTAPFAAGDVVELDLPMAPAFLHADPRVDAVRGCVAVQRGPLVYCAELPAGSAEDLDRLVVSTATPPRYADGRVVVSAGWLPAGEAPWPYGGAPDRTPSTAEQVSLIPYHDWGQAGLCTMRVWLPEA
ncbi:MAG TPA: beta-L-arabinofuranosidase domain-containing protein [Propionicimonas sp.]|uniref:glycoside hydrolase family 127 protein n=1 Tax=Propionicimonas sp. TaxID=1955623 RepID=UPI002F422D1B